MGTLSMSIAFHFQRRSGKARLAVRIDNSSLLDDYPAKGAADHLKLKINGPTTRSGIDWLRENEERVGKMQIQCKVKCTDDEAKAGFALGFQPARP